MEKVIMEVKRPYFTSKKRFFDQMREKYSREGVFVGSWKDPRCRYLQIWEETRS